MCIRRDSEAEGELLLIVKVNCEGVLHKQDSFCYNNSKPLRGLLYEICFANSKLEYHCVSLFET